MEKFALINIANRKIKIKFSSRPDRRDVECLKEAIERLADTDRRLRRKIEGKTMVVSYYEEKHKSHFEVEKDDSIENGSLLNVSLESDSSDEEGAAKQTEKSSTTKDQTFRRRESKMEVPTEEKENRISPKFQVEKSANQRGSNNALANVAIEPISQNFGLQLGNSGSGIIHQRECVIATGSSSIVHVTGGGHHRPPPTKEFLRNKMENWYKKRAQLPQVPWLKKTDSVNILKNYNVTLTDNETKLTIPIQRILEDSCKRILIESPAGFGKTTLAMKIAYDWANKEEYLKRFDFVFVFLLRELRDYSVEDAICSFVNQLTKFRMDADEIDEILKDENILLIFDGYDELPQSGFRQSVNDILGEVENEDQRFTILTTCRTGMFQSEHSRFGFGKRKLMYRRIDIEGLNNDQVKMLLKHILQEEEADVDRTYEKIVEIGKKLPDISKCPLYVMIIAFLHSKREDVEIGIGRSEFYKKMIATLMKNCNRTNLSETSADFENSLQNNLQLKKHDIIEFGKLSLELIAKSEFAYTDSELITKMYEAGFLTKSENFLQEESVYYFKPIHRSFAEFFAAYYLWQEIENSRDRQLSNEYIKMLTEQFVSSKGTTLIHSFLLGFLREESYVLFNQLNPYAYVYSQMEVGFWNMLAECSKIERLIEYLVPFIPPSAKFERDIPSEIFQYVIRKGTETNQINRVVCNISDCQVLELPNDMCIHKIRLTVFPSNLQSIIVGQRTLFANPGVQCDNLTVAFNGKFNNDEMNRELLVVLLKLIGSIKFKSLSLTVFENSTCKLLNESILKNDLLREIEVRQFYCEVKDEDSSWTELVASVIESDNLVSLKLIFYNPVSLKALKPITLCAGKSKLLTGLFIWNQSSSPVEVDLDDVFTNPKHRWNEIYIRGCQINLKISFPDDTDITCLTLIPRNYFNPIIGNSVIKSFRCTFSLLLKIEEREDFHSTTFANKLEEMIVDFSSSNIDGRNLTTFNTFAAIRKLIINLNPSIIKVPEEFAKVLRSMRIEHLEIRFYEENERAVAKLMFTLASVLCIKEEGGSHSMETIVLYIGYNNLLESRNMLEPLLKCLEEKRLKTLGIIRPFTIAYESIYYEWIDVDKFALNYRIAESKEKDTEYWKMEYCNNVVYDQIEITSR